MKKNSQIILMLVVLMSISVFLGCNSDVSSKDSSFALAGTYTGEVAGNIDTIVINQDKTFLWSKADGTQFKGTVNYDGSSAVEINMTHQKNNGSDWTENSISFTGTYSNNTITINVSGNSFVFTKQ